MEFVDIEDFIANVSPGLAAYGRWKENLTDDYELAFFIQEEKKYINKVSKYPQIRIKAALAVYDNVPLVVVLILVNNDFDMLYEIYFNYHQTGEGRKYFEDLTSQDRIVLFFYQGAERKRNIKIDNSLKDAFKGCMTEIMKYAKWSMDQFDSARELLYLDYPKPEVLWRKLKADFSIFN